MKKNIQKQCLKVLKIIFVYGMWAAPAIGDYDGFVHLVANDPANSHFTSLVAHTPALASSRSRATVLMRAIRLFAFLISFTLASCMVAALKRRFISSRCVSYNSVARSSSDKALRSSISIIRPSNGNATIVADMLIGKVRLHAW